MQSQGIFLIKAVCRITENDLTFSDYIKKAEAGENTSYFSCPKKEED